MSAKTIRILMMADTHGRHRDVDLPRSLKEFDVLIHAGDICKSVGVSSSNVLQQNAKELMDFAQWMQDIPIPHKVVIAGNHDFIFEHLAGESRMIMREAGVTYLQDSEEVIHGLKFYGSPRTPWFGDMAFTGARGRRLDWGHIPDDTDVLVTHGPPYGMRDQIPVRGRIQSTGCVELLRAVERVKPKLHVFGHIHGARGVRDRDRETTAFYNCAVVNHRYEVKFPPMTFELEAKDATLE